MAGRPTLYTEENRKGFIYTLVDPVTHEVRYVGQTWQPARRKNQHQSVSNNLSGRRVNHWILSLLQDGLKPIFVKVEETENLDEREMFWVAEHRRRGARLLNMNNGGAHPLQFAASPRANIKGRDMRALQRVRISMAQILNSIKKDGHAEVYERLAAKGKEVDEALARAFVREGKVVAVERINAELVRRGYVGT